MRLIDADAFDKRLIRLGALSIKSALDEEPTIEAEPVRYGRWIERKSLHADGGVSAQCSICRRNIQYLGNPLKYCPNCGCKMS